jgi:hypothetical protein
MAGSKIPRAGAARALLAVSIAMFWTAFAPPARSALSENDPPLQKSATFDTQLPHLRVNQEHRRVALSVDRH